jgi:carbon-monoxide dehydrogenase medium subunit
VKPAPFDYVRPASLDEAVAALDDGGEARILAGGQSLVPLLNMRLVRPRRVVDITGIPKLGAIAQDGPGLRLGALVCHTDLIASPLARERAPLLVEAARHVGHRAIRNRGTLGGSLAHADPAAELPAAVVALAATLVVAGPGGTREVPAGEFFRGLLATALGPREILVEVRVPGPAATAWGFAEVARRPGDFALAGVVAVLHPAPGAPGRGRPARLVAFGAGDVPVRLTAAEALLAGVALDAEAARRAGRAGAAQTAPPDDVHASAGYRRHLVAVLAEQALLDAAARGAAALGGGAPPTAAAEGRA